MRMGATGGGDRTAGGWVLLAVVAFGSAVLGWFAMWTSPVSHDEAYLLLTLRGWVERGHLYDAVYSQYGPFYYLVFGLPARVLGATWTLDAGRITNLVLWVASSFLFGLAAWKLTRRISFGLATQLLTFSMLNTLVNEPMHPGALVCVLLAGLVANVAALRPRAPGPSDVLSGALVAALALVKLNVGALAGVALLFVVTEGLPPDRSPWWRRAGIALLVITGPALLLSDGVRQWKVEFAALYVAAAALVVVASAAWRARTAEPTSLSLPRIVSGFAVVAVLTLSFALVTGTTVAGLWDGIVARPLDFSATVSVPIDIPGWAWAWLAAVPLAALGLHAALRAEPSRALGIASGAVRAGGGLLVIAFVLGRPRGLGYLIAVPGTRFALLPLAALVLLPPITGRGREPGTLVARRLLGAAAVTQSLHAYPVPGSQVSWALMLTAVCGAVTVSDGVSEILDGVPLHRASSRGLAIGTGAVLVLAVVLVLPGGVSGSPERPGEQFADWYREYQRARPLRAASAGRIRLADTAGRRQLDAVTAVTRANCDSFVALSTNDAYYLLTGIDPPTGYNAPRWERLLTTDEQRSIVDAIEDDDRLCLLLGRGAGAARADGSLQLIPTAGRPLVRFLRDERWDVVRQLHLLQVLRRRDAA
jgi:hypothetical protein